MGLRRLSRRWLGGAVAGLTLLFAASYAGSAHAAGESIYITPPTSATTGIAYSFTVSGYAPQTEQLYFFDDVESCGSSPYVEHAVHDANGDDYTVDGNFQYVSSGWKSPKAATYHVCAYLVDASQPLNPSAGVLAESFQSFAIQQGCFSWHAGKFLGDGAYSGGDVLTANAISCAHAFALAHPNYPWAKSHRIGQTFDLGRFHCKAAPTGSAGIPNTTCRRGRAWFTFA